MYLVIGQFPLLLYSRNIPLSLVAYITIIKVKEAIQWCRHLDHKPAHRSEDQAWYFLPCRQTVTLSGRQGMSLLLAPHLEYLHFYERVFMTVKLSINPQMSCYKCRVANEIFGNCKRFTKILYVLSSLHMRSRWKYVLLNSPSCYGNICGLNKNSFLASSLKSLNILICFCVKDWPLPNFPLQTGYSIFAAVLQ